MENHFMFEPTLAFWECVYTATGIFLVVYLVVGFSIDRLHTLLLPVRLLIATLYGLGAYGVGSWTDWYDPSTGAMLVMIGSLSKGMPRWMVRVHPEYFSYYYASLALASFPLAIAYPVVNYLLQADSMTVGYLQNDITSGLLTLRLSSITVGFALILVASRMMLELLGFRQRALSFVCNPQRNPLLRMVLSPFLEEPASLRLYPWVPILVSADEFASPYQQTVARIKLSQTGFFTLVILTLWLAHLGYHETFVTKAISVALFFIVDDWFVLEAHLMNLRGGVTLWHRLRFCGAFATIAFFAGWSVFGTAHFVIAYTLAVRMACAFGLSQFLLWSLGERPR
jgi:hypothetical protein